MGLTGTLETMSLGDLLQWIATSNKTGLITIKRGKSRLQLSVGAGRVHGAYSNEPPMLLGQFLLSRGKIDEQTLHDALARQDATRQPLGEVLVDDGAISADELERYVVLKAEETIFGILEWTDAMFEFEPGAKADPRMVTMDHGIDDLMMRGAQRRDEMSRMRTVLGEPGVVLCRTDVELPEQARKSPMAARIYGAIDGRRTLADILLHSRSSEYFATKFLYELHRAGVVRIKDIQGGKPPSDGPQAMSASIRQLLDEGQFEGALSLVNAALRVYPENDELRQQMAKAEAGFLEWAYQSRVSPHWVPRLVVPAEEALDRDDVGPNERFVLDLIQQDKWSVKAMTRIAPLHEVDVVQATLGLLDKGIVQMTGQREAPDEEPIAALGEELQKLSGDLDAEAVDQTIDSVFAGDPADPAAETTAPSE